MNLGHAIGAAARSAVRQEQRRGAWHAIGRITIERVREVVAEYDPIRYERWQTAADERTCSECGPLDGAVWPAGEGFHPPIHDNCRCQRVYDHVEYRTRLVETWRDVARPITEWTWRTG